MADKTKRKWIYCEVLVMARVVSAGVQTQAAAVSRSTRFVNPCALQVVRRSLKEPIKTKAMTRDNTDMKVTSWENGKKTAVRKCCLGPYDAVEFLPGNGDVLVFGGLQQLDPRRHKGTV